MTDEYKMLRSEMENCIKRQENLTNIVFTVLGLSSVLSINGVDAIYLLFLLGLSTIILARIVYSRQSVYYLSTYLRCIEKTEEDVKWETRVHIFKSLKSYTSPRLFGACRKLILSLRNFSYALFSAFIFVQIIRMFLQTQKGMWDIVIVILSGVILLVTIALCIYICVDRNIDEIYIEKWEKIIADDKTCFEESE